MWREREKKSGRRMGEERDRDRERQRDLYHVTIAVVKSPCTNKQNKKIIAERDK